MGEKELDLKKVGLGMGINRGLMFLGIVGSFKILDCTIIGPDVNIAQGLALEIIFGEILIDGRFQATLSGNISFRSQRS